MVGLIAPQLSSDAFGAALHAGLHDVTRAAFWIAVVQIIVINLLLSGDNAVVIAMACRGLPRRQRLWGLAIGAGVAVVLLVVFAGVVTHLMRLPYVKLVGGIALLYIGAKLLAPAPVGRTAVAAETQLWRAVRIVVVADIVMSLDNIIAVASAANGDVLLLAIGLAVSIPLIVAGAALVMTLLDRFPILVWGGAAMLGWVAGEVIVTDPVLAAPLRSAFGEQPARQLVFAAAAAGAVVVVAVGAAWRRRRWRER